ncbi:hypothetical protein [Nocardioides sp. GY 10127]|uniref:hypothetical protein n=1 Tax=Nocardioides sp. GY 10127 TaxID=2569762 RepID=UPI0010A77D65|nr:hypothetical protein [Nocardioides sp. GY 10127]TIC85652.1 hypothetical protein E8D37_03295 [Nocardioides sp. GY 10127]
MSPFRRLRAALPASTPSSTALEAAAGAAGTGAADEPVPDCVALVLAHRVCAQRALQEATGGASLCSLARSGHPLPAATFHEGAVVALGLVLRAQRAAGPGSACDGQLLEVVTRVRDQWWAEQAPMAARGPAWDAYATGGDEALRDLLEELGARTDR